MIWRIGRDVLDLYGQIDWLVDHGFEAAAFWTCAGQPGVWQGFDRRHASAGEIDRLTHALSPFAAVDLHAHRSLPVADHAARDQALVDLRRVITFADTISAQTVTVHVEREADISPQTLPGLLSALDALNMWAHDAGVRLGLELTSHYDLASRPGTPNIGFTLDVGHVHFDDGAGFRSFGSVAGLVDAMAERLVHVHAHDYDGVLDHLPIGAGSIDWPPIVDALVAAKYEGVVCLELNADRASEADLATSHQTLRQWIARAT